MLSHRNAKEIPGSVNDDSSATIFRASCGALAEAIKVKNPKLVYKIVCHPNTKDIPLVGIPCIWLKPFLTCAIESQDPLLIAAVLHHPKIIDLPVEDLM